MQKEPLSLTLIKLILTVSIFVCVGVILGLTGYLLTRPKPAIDNFTVVPSQTLDPVPMPSSRFEEPKDVNIYNSQQFTFEYPANWDVRFDVRNENKEPTFVVLRDKSREDGQDEIIISIGLGATPLHKKDLFDGYVIHTSSEDDDVYEVYTGIVESFKEGVKRKVVEQGIYGKQPYNVKVESFTAEGSVYISWFNPRDDDFSYTKIYRSEKEGELGTVVYRGKTKGAINYSTTQNEYYNLDLKNGTKYYYTIRAVDKKDNESDNKDQYAITPMGTGKYEDYFPLAPVRVSLQRLSEYNIQLNWIIPHESDLNHARVYRSLSKGELGSMIWEGYGASNRYEDTNADFENQYCYTIKIQAFHKGNFPESSSAKQFCLGDFASSYLPIDVKITKESNDVFKVSWNFPDNDEMKQIATYNIYRTKENASTKELIKTIKRDNEGNFPTGFSDSGLAKDTKYCYSIQSVDGFDTEDQNIISYCETM